MEFKFNPSEVEQGIRAAAAEMGEEILKLTFDDDANPVFTLAARERTREEVGEVGRKILESAMRPLVQRAIGRQVFQA